MLVHLLAELPRMTTPWLSQPYKRWCWGADAFYFSFKHWNQAEEQMSVWWPDKIATD